MNPKLDEIAKAIRDECRECHYLTSLQDDHHLWISLAKAAGVAMRKPTEDMVFAGVRGATGGVMCSWQIMVDEMMK